MKLVQIWNAREAFGRLAQLRKPPKLAYRLLKYARKFSAEADACESQRIKCVCEAASVEPGSAAAAGVMLMPGTEEFSVFMEKFNEYLLVESDLEPVGLGMEAMIEGLDAERGNVLSENDLALLEPFFQEKTQPDLKLVEKA